MIDKRQLRSKRKARIRAVIRGSASRPRLTVYRSNKSTTVQIIDDDAGKTLVSLSAKGKNVQSAKTLGEAIAKLAVKKGITKAVFDRSGYRYHGSIQALADAVREGGLTI